MNEDTPRWEAFLSVAAVAKVLSVHPDTVYRALRAGRLPGYRIGRCWRVLRGALLNQMQEQAKPRT